MPQRGHTHPLLTESIHLMNSSSWNTNWVPQLSTAKFTGNSVLGWATTPTYQDQHPTSTQDTPALGTADLPGSFHETHLLGLMSRALNHLTPLLMVATEGVKGTNELVHSACCPSSVPALPPGERVTVSQFGSLPLASILQILPRPPVHLLCSGS